jgi:hypothetical protein
MSDYRGQRDFCLGGLRCRVQPRIHFGNFLIDYFIYPIYLCESVLQSASTFIMMNTFHDTFQTLYIVICGITLRISDCKTLTIICVDLTPSIISRGKDHTHSDPTK